MSRIKQKKKTHDGHGNKNVPGKEENVLLSKIGTKKEQKNPSEKRGGFSGKGGKKKVVSQGQEEIAQGGHRTEQLSSREKGEVDW